MSARAGPRHPEGVTARLRSLCVALALLLAATTAPAAYAAPPPLKVSFRDGRTSDPAVDISRVSLEGSWYWTSEQYVRVAVPGGFRPGHRLTVWFDIDGDSTPDGHYTLRLGEVKNRKQGYLRDEQEFRLGGGWGYDGTKVRCAGDDGYAPPESSDVTRGQREVGLALDLWNCLRRSAPVSDDDSGSWRVSVEVSRGRLSDHAPGPERWSPAVAGWGPCDPSGGSCSG